jgi:hypothetical protein
VARVLTLTAAMALVSTCGNAPNIERSLLGLKVLTCGLACTRHMCHCRDKCQSAGALPDAPGRPAAKKVLYPSSAHDVSVWHPPGVVWWKICSEAIRSGWDRTG